MTRTRLSFRAILSILGFSLLIVNLACSRNPTTRTEIDNLITRETESHEEQLQILFEAFRVEALREGTRNAISLIHIIQACVFPWNPGGTKDGSVYLNPSSTQNLEMYLGTYTLPSARNALSALLDSMNAFKARLNELYTIRRKIYETSDK